MSAGESHPGAGAVAAGIGNLHVAENESAPPWPGGRGGARRGWEMLGRNGPGGVENLTTGV